MSHSRTLQAAVAYTALTALLTWPLVPSISSDVAHDLGDPLLNAWILAWSGERLGRLAGGDLTALQGYWDANIFYPEAGTLAYSEHLTAQALFTLPLRAFTQDPIVLYNVAFLFTFPLSALGAFLLARELSGSAGAAFLAGLVFGFAPYRFDQLPHLQTLSTQWMPLALLALRRHVVTGRSMWLIAAVASLLLNNLSCGYYLFYFSPFVALYVLHEMAHRGRLRDGRLWGRLLLAAAALLLLTLPFLLPYLRARQEGVLVRSRGEVESFSADVFSLFTAPESNRLWAGVLRPTSEKERTLFPSLTALTLAAMGALAAAREAWARSAGDARGGGAGQWRRRLSIAALGLGVGGSILVIVHLAGLSAVSGSGEMGFSARSPRRALVTAVAAFVALAGLSGRARRFLGAIVRSPEGFLVAGLGLALWLSLGPTVRSLGRPVAGLGLYGLLYEYVPGFDGLRVPARFGMIALLFLCLLAAFGARRALVGPRGAAVIASACLLFLLESSSVPIPLASPWREGRLDRYQDPPLDGTPPIYDVVARLPPKAVIAELPFGRYPNEQVYMLHSTTHWRRLLNGRSGVSPPSYERRRYALRDVFAGKSEAWRALLDSGATHVLVHEGLWGAPRRGRKVSEWLEQGGARLVARVGRDALLELPGRDVQSGPSD